ncbi:hypothetical protein D3C78_1412480 [compost metagenome]
MSTNRDAREQCRIRTDAATFLQHSGFVSFRVALGARHPVVGECSIGADEDIVLDHKPLPEKHATFHSDVVADYNSSLDQGVSADVAIAANLRAFEDDRVLPDSGFFANGIGLHIGQRMNTRHLRSAS